MTADVAFEREHPLRPFTLTEKLLLVHEIAVTYVRARWWLRCGTVEQATRIARAGCERDHDEPGSPGTYIYAMRLGRLVARGLDRLPGDTRCLTRSVVLVRLLSRRGIASTLVIGVQARPSFSAHAWVELDGQPVLHPSEYADRRLLEL